jgi:hypothetical protein
LDVGVYNFKNFLNNPILQENAFYALLCINKWELRKEIKNGTFIKDDSDYIN